MAIFNGKIHYKWAIFNSYVKLPEGISFPSFSSLLSPLHSFIFFTKHFLVLHRKKSVLFVRLFASPFPVSAAYKSEHISYHIIYVYIYYIHKLLAWNHLDTICCFVVSSLFDLWSHLWLRPSTDRLRAAILDPVTSLTCTDDMWIGLKNEGRNQSFSGCILDNSYPGWWFGTWMDYDFPFSWECHHPNWQFHIFRGRYTTKQIPSFSKGCMEQWFFQTGPCRQGLQRFPRSWGYGAMVVGCGSHHFFNFKGLWHNYIPVSIIIYVVYLWYLCGPVSISI